MGKITTFNITQFKQVFKLKIFVETGTYKGDGIAEAIKYQFKDYYSIQCLQNLYLDCKQRFKNDVRIKLFLGYSKDKLPQVLNEIPQDQNILFWLDAHLPCYYSNTQKENFSQVIRFPIQDQLTAIKNKRKGNDVIIMDDLGMYIQGDFQRQRFPEHLRSAHNNLKFTLNQLFKQTHDIVFDYSNSGYVVITPKFIKD